MNLPDFELTDAGRYAPMLHANHLTHFHQLCAFVAALPYGRTASRSDFTTLFTENKGTCSLKHGLLSELAERNGHADIELVLGIYLLNAENTPKATAVLQRHGLTDLPEAHAYLRYQNQRFDFTSPKAMELRFEPFLVREQRCEPQQLTDWKPMIHQHYLGGWINRKNLPFTVEQLWEIREEVIRSLEN